MNTVLDVPGFIKHGHFLISLATVTFRRRNLLLGSDTMKNFGELVGSKPLNSVSMDLSNS